VSFRRRTTTLLAAGAFAVILAGTHAIWLSGAAIWLDVGERPRPVDAVYILGGADVAVRALVGAALIRTGYANRALVSGVHYQPDEDDGVLCPQQERACRVLAHRGIAQSQIEVLGRDHRTTFDEAASLKRYLTAHPRATVAVVTSDFHTRRTRWILRQSLGERYARVVVVSSPSVTFVPRDWWRTPRGASDVAGEYPKLLFYWFRYSWAPYGWGMALLAVAFSVRSLRRRRLPPTAVSHC